MNNKADEMMAELVARVQLLSEGWRRPLPLRAPRPALRLVYDDRSRPHLQRNVGAKPHEDDGDGASVKVRPELTLVHSSD